MKYFTRHNDLALVITIALYVVTISTLSEPTKALAESYPNRDITFINPYAPDAPGGSSDVIARQFVKQLEKFLGGNVNVENKPGGSGTIGMGIVVRAKPNGYTIGLGANSPLVYEPLVVRGLAYKTPDDYQSIVKITPMPRHGHNET